MGLDLTLMPFYANDPTCDIAHTMIDCAKRRDWFNAIENVEEKYGRDVPADFYTFRSRDDNGDTCYGITTTTPYGKRLKYVSAGDIVRSAGPYLDDFGPINCAVIAYLKQLPSEWPVALFWN